MATTISFEQLMRDNLILARNENAGMAFKVGQIISHLIDFLDVFNALDVMENSSIFSTLNFGAGDGNLQYYLYNWKCPVIEPSEVGLVLV